MSPRRASTSARSQWIHPRSSPAWSSRASSAPRSRVDALSSRRPISINASPRTKKKKTCGTIPRTFVRPPDSRGRAREIHPRRSEPLEGRAQEFPVGRLVDEEYDTPEQDTVEQLTDLV